MTTPNTLNPTQLETLKEKIKDVRIAMMTTQRPDGEFHTRPMATHEVDQEGCMWFFTFKDSHKIAEISQNDRIGLGFSDPDSELYVSTSGRAEQVDDQIKINDLWSDFLKTWFPKGKDDPNLTLLKVSTHAGEYWDKPGGKMMNLFEMAKGALTGQPSHSGKNEKFGDEPQ